MPPTLKTADPSVDFAQRNSTISAVRQVSLAVTARECVGIVGESGSGKTQVFMAAMGLLAANAKADGSVRFESEELLRAAPRALNRTRGSKLTMSFQDRILCLP